jgi:peptidoglycan/LPS O-acetylase OafA/YrhL
MLLLHATIDGVTWTMQAELLAIPVILVGFLCWRRGWTALLLALAVALVLLSYSGDWNRLFPGQSITQPLFAFAFGVYLRARGATVVARIPPGYRGLCAAGALIALAAAALLGGSKHRMLIEAWSATVLLGILVYGRQAAIAKFLGLGPIRFLGRISYSFYLLHPLGLAVVWRRPEFWGPVVEAGMPRLLLVLLLWAATVLAVLPIAYLVHRFVELPGIELGRRVCARLEGRGAAVPAPETAAVLPRAARVD